MTWRGHKKMITLSCTACDGQGLSDRGYGRVRCAECRGRGEMKVANPFYVEPGEVPTWFQMGGGEGWAREVRRLAGIAGLKPNAAAIRRRFVATARRLEPWRLRSSIHCNIAAVREILAMLENCRRDPQRRVAGECGTPWTADELGALIVEARNRLHWHELDRSSPRQKGPRFELAKLPDPALERLIQRHPNLDVVEQLRAERNRRLSA